MSKRTRGKHCCAVADCSNWGFKEPGTIYHTFPKNEELRRVWISLCKRTPEFNANNGRVCCKHFLASDYERDLRNELLGLPTRKVLRSNAVPSQYLRNWNGDDSAGSSSSDNTNQVNWHGDDSAGSSSSDNTNQDSCDRPRCKTTRSVTRRALSNISTLSPKKRKVDQKTNTAPYLDKKEKQIAKLRKELGLLKKKSAVILAAIRRKEIALKIAMET